MALFGWIEEKHLDVPEDNGSNGFLMFAQQGKLSLSVSRLVPDRSLELLKINHYKAPRDKLICVLNCSKVIFGPKYLFSCFPGSVVVWLTTVFFLALAFLLPVFRSIKASPQRGRSGCVPTYFDLCGFKGKPRELTVERRASLVPP